MEDKSKYPLTLENLRRAGDARKTLDWAQGKPDYVKQFGLGPEHIPVLINITRQWIEPEQPEPKDETFYAPVHAWRALGQLRTVEAVEPLLAMQHAMDKKFFEWYVEEFPEVFGLIGPPAISVLTAFLANRQNIENPRATAANGLCKIAERHPETRDQVVEIITRQLANYEPEAYSLNGFLIADLLDLKAVESAEVIERAYAAEVVDEIIINWSDVCRELGVEGLGLVPEPEEPFFRDMPSWPSFPDNDIDEDSDDDMPVPDQGAHDYQQEKERRKKEKAKQKRQEKAKRRNRKKR